MALLTASLLVLIRITESGKFHFEKEIEEEKNDLLAYNSVLMFVK